MPLENKEFNKNMLDLHRDLLDTSSISNNNTITDMNNMKDDDDFSNIIDLNSNNSPNENSPNENYSIVSTVLNGYYWKGMIINHCNVQ